MGLIATSSMMWAQKPDQIKPTDYGRAEGCLPIVQTRYTADPAPVVINDTVFLYVTHDENDADNFKMKDWLLYTSTDMVNWEDHGAVASLQDFDWRVRDNGAWALQVIERNGKYYMYCPLHGRGIGVLVGTSPYGPFKDPIGKPLVWDPKTWYDIDPTPFIDKDGQAYLAWGNPECWMVKLNEDMISTKGEIVKLPHIEDYQEGPWLYSRGANYYLAFASTCCPEGIGYAMSKSPMGPWTYKGHIMNHTPKTRGNHPGIIDYKGHTYCFGLNYDLKNRIIPEHHERRSVSVAEMFFNNDATIKELPYFLECPTIKPLCNFNPYRKVRAAYMAQSWGLQAVPHEGYRNGWEAEKKTYITDIQNGEWMMLKSVDFGTGEQTRFDAVVSSPQYGGVIEVHVDSLGGQKVCEVAVPVTGGAEKWITVSTDKINEVKGVHDMYFFFRSSNPERNREATLYCDRMFNFDSWEFKKKYHAFTVGNHQYNPDPAPVVDGETMYVFTGHDADTATYFRMPDWQVFSSKDMKNWTDHGVVMSTKVFKWAKQGDNAWASQAIKRNGKWYWYVAAEDKAKGMHGV